LALIGLFNVDADIADQVRLEQPQALAHAHGKAEHHGGAAEDGPALRTGEVGLFHEVVKWVEVSPSVERPRSA
jgi:hypothetical protein